jgi:hypothetical protein
MTSLTRRTSRKAIDSPWPMIGSLCPAASPTKTTPGAVGVSTQWSSFEKELKGPIGRAAAILPA